MAAFPIAGEPSPSTRLAPDSGLNHVRATNGELRGTMLFNKTYFTISRVDEMLTQAEVNSIHTQFDATPDVEHTMTVNSLGYTFRYLNRPIITGYHGEYRTVQTLAHGYLT